MNALAALGPHATVAIAHGLIDAQSPEERFVFTVLLRESLRVNFDPMLSEQTANRALPRALVRAMQDVYAQSHAWQTQRLIYGTAGVFGDRIAPLMPGIVTGLAKTQDAEKRRKITRSFGWLNDTAKDELGRMLSTQSDPVLIATTLDILGASRAISGKDIERIVPFLTWPDEGVRLAGLKALRRADVGWDMIGPGVLDTAAYATTDALRTAAAQAMAGPRDKHIAQLVDIWMRMDTDEGRISVEQELAQFHVLGREALERAQGLR